MKILLKPDAADGGATITAPAAGATETKEDRMARIEAEHAAMKNKLDQIDAEKELLGEEEALIKKKTDAGLSRVQAMAVIKRQKFHDALLEEQWGERRAPILDILQRLRCTKGLIPMKARLEIRQINAAITLSEIQRAQAEIEWSKRRGAVIEVLLKHGCGEGIVPPRALEKLQEICAEITPKEIFAAQVAIAKGKGTAAMALA